MTSDFEDQYLDVLQNIESAIVSVYRQQAELVDYEVEQALNGLLLEYQAQQQHRLAHPPALTGLTQYVYERVKQMCEWRLGRAALWADGQESEIPAPEPISVDEMVACLKRIRKSVQKWNKRGGRRGYLEFVEQYVV